MSSCPFFVSCKTWGFLLLSVPLFTIAEGRDVVSRVRLSFDQGWRFQRDPLPKHIKASDFTWRWAPANVGSLSLKHLPSNVQRLSWSSSGVGGNVFDSRPGFVWFQANLGAGAVTPDRVLRFEYADDNAVVFLNGVRVAEHYGWNGSFDVRLAKAWRTGQPNLVTVLIENTSGPGGLGPSRILSLPFESTSTQALPGFDDRLWTAVSLPHDYVIEGATDANADNSHGSLPVTQAWYRKTFTLPAAWRGRSVWVDFDGVFRNSTVYLNGKRLGTQPSGYMGFRFDLARYARFGARNVLAVRVDPREPEGWWYEGGGIYRHVWLNVAHPLHVAPWGVFVRTEVDPKKRAGTIQVETQVTNAFGKTRQCVVESKIVGPTGTVVSTIRTSIHIRAHSTQTVHQSAKILDAKLWSPETPNLYQAYSRVIENRKEVDRQVSRFGVRQIEFDKDHGFFLNGKPVKLKGTCNHQDHAGLGIALPDSMQEWRIRQLKNMGSNAYRCAHNPPAPELLDACDRLGMLVMDESRHLGDTVLSKTPHGTQASNLQEVRDMVRRDRNHPSVILWSLANEEPLQGSPEGARLFGATRKAVRLLDPTRPCTAAMNGGWLESGIAGVSDLVGINYYVPAYDETRRARPDKAIFASETASTYGTRGIYQTDPKAAEVSAYDLSHPAHGLTAEQAWKPVAERAYMAGAFVWTGFDYRGEPAPYGWPSVGSQFGILDRCGFPKDNYWYYKAWWGTAPVVHILPHWNWPGKEGQLISVWCHSNANEVELRLNGKRLGIKAMPRLGHLQWAIPYQPGTLEAVGYRDGKIIARDRVETTGKPIALRLVTDANKLKADGQDVIPVRVEAIDALGRVVPTACVPVHFAVKGVGEILGVGNGDPNSHAPEKVSYCRTFNGLAQVLVGRTLRAGRLTLRATSPGMKTTFVQVVAK